MNQVIMENMRVGKIQLNKNSKEKSCYFTLRSLKPVNRQVINGKEHNLYFEPLCIAWEEITKKMERLGIKDGSIVGVNATIKPYIASQGRIELQYVLSDIRISEEIPHRNQQQPEEQSSDNEMDLAIYATKLMLETNPWGDFK